MKTEKLRAFYMHDERTDNTMLGVEFKKNRGGWDFLTVDSDLAENPEKLRQALKKKGAMLTGSKALQMKLVKRLLDNIEPKILQLAMKPGFRGAGFVLGKTMIGTANGAFVWNATSEKPDIGQQAGTLLTWQSEVVPIIAQSSFATLAVFIAFASPLVTYVNQRLKATDSLSPLLSESAVFNLSGESGTGKTSLSRVAAGTFGSPDAVFKWDFSRPGLEAAAESRNDLALVLDDTEKHVEIEMKLKTALRLVGQVVPSGMSKALSPGSRDNGSPERRWTAFGISSSPLPLDELAERDNWSRSDGEKVRFINIALPKAVEAGIFDRVPENTKDQIEAGKALIKELERAVAINYGIVFPEWIKFLLVENRALKIQMYASRFVSKLAANGTGYDKRYAEKFGILYAAGKLAIEAGILPLPQDLPWKAVCRCYKLALRSAATVDATAAMKIDLLARLVKQKARFPKASVSSSKGVAYGRDTLGVRIVVKGIPKCAMRDNDLTRYAGSKTVAKAMRLILKAAGALGTGQGTAGTSQPGVKVKIGGKFVKPRFWIIDEKKLGRSASK